MLSRSPAKFRKIARVLIGAFPAAPCRMWDFRSVASGPKPFFAYLGPHAPHYPAQPAPWYVDAFPEIKIPLTPNYNVSSPDKTQHIRQNPPFTPLVKC